MSERHLGLQTRFPVSIHTVCYYYNNTITYPTIRNNGFFIIDYLYMYMHFQTPCSVACQQPPVRVLHHPDHHRQLRGHVHGHTPSQRRQDHPGSATGKR